MKYLPTFIAVGSIALIAIGCGPKNGQGVIAPAKPLSQVEEDLLRRLEALPKEQRQDFVARNGKTIINLAERNKTFGDRMNADMGLGASK